MICHILLTAAIMIFIFIQSALPDVLSARESGVISAFLAELFRVDHEAVSFAVRKAAHFTEYAVLGALAANLLRQASRDPKWASRVAVIEPAFRLVLVSWFFSVAYAASDEFHQLFVPGRAGAAGDVAIDSAGALVGVLLYAAFALRARKA